MFKGVFQCLPALSLLYFGPFNHFHCSPLPLYPLPSHFQQLSVHILTSSTFTSYVLQYCWCSIFLFSFPSSSGFHRVVPPLQTCSTSEFVCDHACFCGYIYLWIHLPHMRVCSYLLFAFMCHSSDIVLWLNSHFPCE
jgi:hypothetical protein